MPCDDFTNPQRCVAAHGSGGPNCRWDRAAKTCYNDYCSGLPVEQCDYFYVNGSAVCKFVHGFYPIPSYCQSLPTECETYNTEAACSASHKTKQGDDAQLMCVWDDDGCKRQGDRDRWCTDHGGTTKATCDALHVAIDASDTAVQCAYVFHTDRFHCWAA